MTKRLCAVQICVDYYLMAEAQALRVFAALRGAERIERDYTASTTRRWRRRERDPLDEIEMVTVEASDVLPPRRSARPLMIEDKR